MKKVCLLLMGTMVLAAAFAMTKSAKAFPQFEKEFSKKYVGDASTDAQKSLKKEIARVKKCNICHDPRKGDDGKVSKKNKNPYGVELGKLINKNDKKDVKKINAALEKVAGMSAKKDGPKYGELLEKGKLPFEYKD